MPDGPGGFAQNSSCSALLRIPLSLISLRLPDYHRLWLNFPEHSTHEQSTISRSYNSSDALPHLRSGLFPGRSPLLGESLFIFSSSRYSDVSVPLVCLFTYVKITGLQPAGLSHSEIPGSKDICSYPRLIAAYHVLHRLREPRHPPDALTFFRHLLIAVASEK